jgi:hypothetical protein
MRVCVVCMWAYMVVCALEGEECVLGEGGDLAGAYLKKLYWLC